MNILDCLIIFGLVLSVLYSTFRGLVREIFSLLSIIAGLLAAVRTYHFVAEPIEGFIHNQAASRIIGFLVCLIAVSLAICLAGALVRRLITKANLGWLDRFTGALLGLIKGILISSFIIMLLVSFFPPETPFLMTSKTAPVILAYSAKLTELIPEDMKNTFYEKLDHLKKIWKDKMSEKQ